ncbi:MAG: hypothetical protein R3C49_15360 [Planctomycetaceae bacterium]
MLVRQTLTPFSSLISSFRPTVARPSNADPDCICLWLVRQSSAESIVVWNDRFADASVNEVSELLKANPGSPNDLFSIVSPETRAAVTAQLTGSLAAAEQSQLLVGPMLESGGPLLLVSRRAMLLATAGLGLLLNFLLARLQTISLMTVLILLVVVLTTIYAFVPTPAHLLLTKILPGAGVAIVAAILNRMFGPRHVRPAGRVATGDGSTIFTVAQPVAIKPTLDSTQPVAT